MSDRTNMSGYAHDDDDLGPPEPSTSCEDLSAPHEFVRVSRWRWWLCRSCYAPKSLHPRTGWVKSRPIGDRRFLSADAPHFQEEW